MKLELERMGEEGWGGAARGLLDFATLGFASGINRRCQVLYVRLDATPEERALIKQYGMGGFLLNLTEHFTALQNHEGGYTSLVHLDDAFAGVRMKLPDENLVRIAERLIEERAKGLNTAIKNRAHYHDAPKSRVIDLDD